MFSNTLLLGNVELLQAYFTYNSLVCYKIKDVKLFSSANHQYQQQLYFHVYTLKSTSVFTSAENDLFYFYFQSSYTSERFLSSPFPTVVSCICASFYNYLVFQNLPINRPNPIIQHPKDSIPSTTCQTGQFYLTGTLCPSPG